MESEGAGRQGGGREYSFVCLVSGGLADLRVAQLSEISRQFQAKVKDLAVLESKQTGR